MHTFMVVLMTLIPASNFTVADMPSARTAEIETVLYNAKSATRGPRSSSILR